MTQTLFFTRLKHGQAIAPDLGLGIKVEIWEGSIVGLPLIMLGYRKLLSIFILRTLIGSGRHGLVLFKTLNGETTHFSAFMSRDWRTRSFMAEGDVQIGPVWTAPAWRGRGLAGLAIETIASRFVANCRSFWYLTDASNGASVAAVCKAGFSLAGTGGKRPRFGLSFAGFYDMGIAPDGRS